ncbi:MAG TPA: TolC family protein [Mucilaginibacter sp.]|nr:TolC family protein [Mucilaginibacter sp.]
MKQASLTIIVLASFLVCNVASAQDTLNRQVLTMQEVFKLALENSPQLKVSAKNIDLAKQQKEIIKLYQLPDVSTGLDYGYLSNADVWTPTFSKHEKGEIPHQFTQFSVSATQLIFKGNEVRNNLLKASFEEQVAFLSQENNEEDIKFLVAAKYLDIYRLINQRIVLVNNLQLAKKRLANILTMQKQGMVTENDVLRTKLSISDLELSIRKVDNNVTIANKQLNLVTGLPDDHRLLPDSSLLQQQQQKKALEEFRDIAFKENHELKIAGQEIKIAETNIKIYGSDRYPQIGLYSGSVLQRPFLYTLPSQDVFYNIWQVGLSIKYNISSIYQSPRKIRAGKIQLEQSRSRETLVKDQLGVNVDAGFIKYNEAVENLNTYREDLRSAQENYRIVEKKYYNQLSLLTDILDASSTKISAELKVTDAQIDVIYYYFQLLKTIGTI